MLEISEREIKERLAFDNPWWEEQEGIDPEYREMPPRAYLAPFEELVRAREVKRAVVLMGPRRVGKTVMVYHTIQHLLDDGVPARNILYLSLETPIYTGLGLERLVRYYQEVMDHGRDAELYLFFDEIQYLKGWEVHLKSLVDSFRSYRFVVTGSAAAALRLKSRESGAGRFTEFMLPPLTFAEYLRFINGGEELVKWSDEDGYNANQEEAEALNQEFIRYMNFGGYPEAVFSRRIQSDAGRYIKSDIIDKVLLRDLPSLYGIQDVQELNRLFTTLVYNTGNEVTLEELSKSSGVAKNTLRRYIEYLEAAFLIQRIYRIDENAQRFRRVTSFKVYLTNPSMRAALFGPVDADHEAMGALTETAIFSQWGHDLEKIPNMHYARWKKGEVDMVYLSPETQTAEWAVEIKWSDRPFSNPNLLHAHTDFVSRNSHPPLLIVTTRTTYGAALVGDTHIYFIPSAVYCYEIGTHLLSHMSWLKRAKDFK